MSAIEVAITVSKEAGIESVWGRRLREARENAGLSQRRLGIEAGLDAGVASTRINRYELGVHKADYKIAQLLAKVLDIPTAYLYTDDDQLAEIILLIHRSPHKERVEWLKMLRGSTR